MKPGILVLAASLAASLPATAALAQSAKDWVDVKDPAELRAIYANKTLRGKGGDGSPVVGHYRADGKGLLIVGGQRIPRSWEVKGSEVCVTDAKATNCFQLQRHKLNRNDIIVQHVKDRWIAQLTIEDGVPQF